MGGNNPNEAAAEAKAAYDEARNRDRPLWERYSDWMVGYATGAWGYSYTYERPVMEVITRAVPLTLLYLVPGVLLASLLSVLTGIAGALNRGSVLDRLSRLVVYAGVALPAFYLALMWQRYNPGLWPTTNLGWETPLATPQALGTLIAPALIVGLNLFAVQAWVVRSEAMEIAPAEFVKTLRAGGADTWTIGRHILRNAASPLLAMFVSEILVVLYVTVFIVEIILGIPGIGLVGFRGFEERDIGLVLAVVLLPVVFTLLSNLAKDVVTVYVDPRVSRS